MVVFLLITGIFFALYNLLQQTGDFNSVLENITFIFLILVPIITMRLLAEEASQKTDQLLLTSPLSVTEIVLGKYLAAVAVFLLALLITVLFPLILSMYGSVAGWEIFGSYIGFALLGASFIALGLFISSLTDNQIVAAFGTLGALIIIWILDWLQQGLPTTLTAGVVFAVILVAAGAAIVYAATGNTYVAIWTAAIGIIAVVTVFLINRTLYEGFTVKFFGWFSLVKRYQDLAYGMLNISTIVYYITFCAAFVFLAIRMVDRKRWS
jgi:ABC-2 type transport system permease protein